MEGNKNYPKNNFKRLDEMEREENLRSKDENDRHLEFIPMIFTPFNSTYTLPYAAIGFPAPSPNGDPDEDRKKSLID